MICDPVVLNLLKGHLFTMILRGTVDNHSKVPY